jgi:hypothetical protein
MRRFGCTGVNFSKGTRAVATRQSHSLISHNENKNAVCTSVSQKPQFL